jgi:hypothetical protein
LWNLAGRGDLEELDVDGNIIFKWLSSRHDEGVQWIHKAGTETSGGLL